MRKKILVFLLFFAALVFGLTRLIKRRRRRHRRLRIVFFADGRRTNKMKLKVSQKIDLTIQVKDAKGNDAQLDGKPSWALTAPDLAQLNVSEDGFSATLIPNGPIGSFNVQVHGDGDLTDAVKDILGELPVDLVAADAVTISIAAGTPVDQ
jgi:hypothetical protein